MRTKVVAFTPHLKECGIGHRRRVGAIAAKNKDILEFFFFSPTLNSSITKHDLSAESSGIIFGWRHLKRDLENWSRQRVKIRFLIDLSNVIMVRYVHYFEEILRRTQHLAGAVILIDSVKQESFRRFFSVFLSKTIIPYVLDDVTLESINKEDEIFYCGKDYIVTGLIDIGHQAGCFPVRKPELGKTEDHSKKIGIALGGHSFEQTVKLVEWLVFSEHSGNYQILIALAGDDEIATRSVISKIFKNANRKPPVFLEFSKNFYFSLKDCFFCFVGPGLLKYEALQMGINFAVVVNDEDGLKLNENFAKFSKSKVIKLNCINEGCNFGSLVQTLKQNPPNEKSQRAFIFDGAKRIGELINE